MYMLLMGPVDMKKKYKAEWALVTGAGTGQLQNSGTLNITYDYSLSNNMITFTLNLMRATGIGKSIAETMALQG
jgi:hypothetical protein